MTRSSFCLKTVTNAERQKNNTLALCQKYYLSVALVTIVALMSGCSLGGGFVSVEQKFLEPLPKSGYHRVERGETLYSIAFRYGFDYRELASANNIGSPYTIYPNQNIKLAAAPVKSYNTPNLPVEKPSVSPIVVQNAPKNSPVISQNTPKFENVNTELIWQWPANGRLIGQYSTKDPINKGIDITGALGESVKAATAGTVVYAGQGLRGYGNLVIVKHNDTYLSAYAHTNRIVVSEQEVVKAGQKIAEIGSTGTDQVKLHFEIRQNGKPVDPLQFLPKKPGGGGK